jgi:hypothetical protein
MQKQQALHCNAEAAGNKAVMQKQQALHSNADVAGAAQ